MTEMPSLALLAGGLATRMRPLTEKVPKSLLEIAGEPFIAHQLRLLRREGITQVVLCVGHKWEMIRDFVGDGSTFGIEVIYSVDSPKLLGTGGAIRNALPHLGPEFMVMYGDSWLDTTYAPIVDAFRKSGKPALMTVFRNDGRLDTSNVRYEDGHIRHYDKREHLPQMKHIDWGLGLATAPLFEARPADTPFDLADIYTDLARRGLLAGYDVTTRFYEIGSVAGLHEINNLFRSGENSLS